MAERPHPVGVPSLDWIREILIGREIRGYNPFEVSKNVIGLPGAEPDGASRF